MLVLLVQTFTANSVGLCISAAVPTAAVGQIVAPLCLVILFIFGGLFVNLDQVPHVFRWIQWISFISYSNKALVQNEFDSAIKFTCSPGQACFADGAAVVSSYGLGTPSLWVCVLLNVLIALVMLVVGYMAFLRTSRPLMKLK